MLDIRLIREDFDRVKAAVARKKFDVDFDALKAADEQRRACLTQAENARAAQKQANAEMAKLPKGSPEFQAKLAEMRTIAGQVKELEAQAKDAEDSFSALLMSVPNLPDPSVPDGRNDADNKSIFTWGSSDEKDYPDALAHFDIPWFSKLLDFERGVKVTGAGFPFYVGDMARLVRALLSFFLEEARKNGYEEVMPPILVNAASATATGQLPDKEGMMYFAQEDGMYMVPTAEVPVTNFFRDEILDEEELPVKRCAYTPCFRREAGSWGAHVRAPTARLTSSTRSRSSSGCIPTEVLTNWKACAPTPRDCCKSSACRTVCC